MKKAIIFCVAILFSLVALAQTDLRRAEGLSVIGWVGELVWSDAVEIERRNPELPCAVLIHKSCHSCPEPIYDTLCHFSYEDITLTEDSITFRDMKCIYYHNDTDNPKRVNYLYGTYLIFSFPDGWKYTLELYSFYSSFTPKYAQILYLKEFGNTMPLDKRFFKKDWSKEVAELVKKWNQYNH